MWVPISAMTLLIIFVANRGKFWWQKWTKYSFGDKISALILNHWCLVFFCWFPFYMLRLLYNFTPWLNDRCPSFATFWYGSMALANINSCLNPILYAGLNTRWISNGSLKPLFPENSGSIPWIFDTSIPGYRSDGDFFLFLFSDFEKMHVNYFWSQTKILF